MKSKILVVAVFCAAALVLVLALVLDFGNSPAPTTASRQAAPSTPAAAGTAQPESTPQDSESPAKASDAPSGQSGKPAQKSAAAASATGQAEATRPSWDPEPSAAESRLEVPEQPQAQEFSLPETEPREPVLASAPQTGVAEGELTEGFPATAVPLPDSATIVKSSVEQQAQLVFVGVEGRSEASVDEVLEFYAQHFAQQQWLTTQNNPAEGVKQLSGSFGADSTTVTVRQLPTGATSIVAAGVFELQE